MMHAALIIFVSGQAHTGLVAMSDFIYVIKKHKYESNQHTEVKFATIIIPRKKLTF